MGDFTPPTKSADLERSGQRKEQIGNAAGENRPDPNNPKPRKGPPPAEETNWEHPISPGTRAVVPGAGIVSADADAYPKETGADLPARSQSRKRRTPARAAGSRKPAARKSKKRGKTRARK